MRRGKPVTEPSKQRARTRSVIAIPQIVAAAFRGGTRSVTLIYLNCRASCRPRILAATEVSHDVIYDGLALRLAIDG
jgi:hypothetical protein